MPLPLLSSGFSVTFWITFFLVFQSLTEAKAWSTFRSGSQPFLYKSRRDNATCPVSAYSWLMMRYHNSIEISLNCWAKTSSIITHHNLKAVCFVLTILGLSIFKDLTFVHLRKDIVAALYQIQSSPPYSRWKQFCFIITIRNQRTIANSNQSVDQVLQLSLKCCYCCKTESPPLLHKL